MCRPNNVERSEKPNRMLLLILILGAICVVIAAVGYFAVQNKDLAEYRDVIIVSCMFAITAVCIFGIFAYKPSKPVPVETAAPQVEGSPTEVAIATPEPTSIDDGRSVLDQSSDDSPSEDDEADLLPSKPKKPGDLFRDCEECPEMVVVPAGDNNMGEEKNTPGSKPSEYPLAWTSFRKDFAVGRYEVTVREFSAFANATGFKPSGPCNTDGVGSKKTSFDHPAFTQGPNHPVVCVSWIDAKTYVEWLSAKTGQSYDILSEARWEYARRSKKSVKDSAHVNDEDVQEEAGNVKGDNWTASTSEVGLFNANDFLLYDMLGNVAEWTKDCWLDNHMLRPKDGRAVTDKGNCNAHAVRGGSWDEPAEAARPASRRMVEANTRDWRIGFRIMRQMSTPSQAANLTD